jgi:hypothetical protein
MIGYGFAGETGFWEIIRGGPSGQLVTQTVRPEGKVPKQPGLPLSAASEAIAAAEANVGEGVGKGVARLMARARPQANSASNIKDNPIHAPLIRLSRAVDRAARLLDVSRSTRT